MRHAFPIAAIVAVSSIDQLTKAMAREALTLGRPVEVAPFFNLTLGYNEGVVFGMGADLGWGPWPLIGCCQANANKSPVMAAASRCRLG